MCCIEEKKQRKYSVVNKKINKNEEQRNKYHTIRCYPYVDVWYLKKNILCMENKLKKNSPKCYKNVKTNQCNRE